MREGSREEKTVLDDNASIYTKREYKSGKENMAELKGFAKIQYFCNYYLGKILCLALIAGVFIYLIYSIVRPKPENIFYMAVINPPLDAKVFDETEEDMALYMVEDPDKQEIFIEDTYYFNESSDYEMRMALMTHTAAHEIDAIIVSKREFQNQIDSGIITTLDKVIPESTLQQLDTVVKKSEDGNPEKDVYRILRYTPKESEEFKLEGDTIYEEGMYGIDITDYLAGLGATTMRERYYLAFIINAKHTDQYDTLLKYIFPDILGQPVKKDRSANATDAAE